jgi:hypothetical protein
VFKKLGAVLTYDTIVDTAIAGYIFLYLQDVTAFVKI